jgi:rhodanese-related sulfurtransferase
MPGGFEFAAANGDEPYREFTATALSFPAEQPELVDLSPAQLTDLIASGDIWLIDVRTPEEIADGMIAGADHIAIDTFKPSPAMLEQAAGREIVLYCRSGRRSAIAAADLSSFTGLPVKHLAGGIIAWEAAGGAVE